MKGSYVFYYGEKVIKCFRQKLLERALGESSDNSPEKIWKGGLNKHGWRPDPVLNPARKDWNTRTVARHPPPPAGVSAPPSPGAPPMGSTYYTIIRLGCSIPAARGRRRRVEGGGGEKKKGFGKRNAK